MQKIKKLVPLGLTFAPFIAFGAGVNSIEDLIFVVGDILLRIVPVLIGIAVVFFLIGVIRYITAGEDEEKRTAGRNMMIYGIIGLFVMISVWGLVNILKGTFRLDENLNFPNPIPGPVR